MNLKHVLTLASALLMIGGGSSAWAAKRSGIPEFKRAAACRPHVRAKRARHAKTKRTQKKASVALPESTEQEQE